MIKTYIYDVNTVLKEYDIDALYNELSFDIKKKIDAIKSSTKTNIDIISWAMLYKLYDTEVKNIEIVYNQYGKPYFKDIKDKFFNISHSHDKVFIAISDKEVGIDVEYKKNDAALCMKLAKRFYSDKEYSLLENAIKKSEDYCIDLFYRLWTIRESFVKCLGTGLIYDKTDMAFGFDENDRPYVEYFKDMIFNNNTCVLQELDNNDNYRYCVCQIIYA